ncbi:hypothetical protein [Kribbella shirazensis]|uniref:Uncharacterized protein n=1 Tax=Kribbella shirazensis TaxID=1105143 RepID=A0A7X5VE60_9ACTN|nr:hypothetical protein [Kribbella shirazensis]NIK59131.1 hypothetical protein [Kribbella shirazensis]
MLTDQLPTASLGVLLHASDAEGPHLARRTERIITDAGDQIRTGMALRRVLLTALAHEHRSDAS